MKFPKLCYENLLYPCKEAVQKYDLNSSNHHISSENCSSNKNFGRQNSNELIEENPFDSKILLRASNLGLSELIGILDSEDKGTHDSIPKYFLDISQENLSLVDSKQGKAHEVKQVDRLRGVNNETQQLILQKYYRDRFHPDLKKVIQSDKTYFSMLYELFSKVYKEKPVIRITEVSNNKGSVTMFKASHIFNNEVLGIGYGNSKKKAKYEASKKSLEIFAPSLLENTKFTTFSQDPPLNTSNDKLSWLNQAPFAEKEGGLDQKTIETNLLLNDQTKKGYRNISKNVEVLLNSLEIQLAKRESTNFSRKESFDSIYLALSDFISKAEYYSRGCNNFGNQILVNYYCTKQVFTNLYKLQILLDDQMRENSLLNWINIENNYIVYLYSQKLQKNFSFISPSLETSVEMTKFQFIVNLYSRCTRASEVLKALKTLFDRSVVKKSRIGIQSNEKDISPNNKRSYFSFMKGRKTKMGSISKNLDFDQETILKNAT